MIEFVTNNWIWGAIVLPALLSFYTTWNFYITRFYDSDGNPTTKEELELLNVGNGLWCPVFVQYKFSLFVKKRGVYITHEGGQKEKVDFKTWRSMRKRWPAKEKPTYWLDEY